MQTKCSSNKQTLINNIFNLKKSFSKTAKNARAKGGARVFRRLPR